MRSTNPQYILIVPELIGPLGNQLEDKLKKMGWTIKKSRNIEQDLGNAAACIVMLSTKNLQDPNVVTAIHTPHPLLIPVLTEKLELPLGQWTVAPLIKKDGTSDLSNIYDIVSRFTPQPGSRQPHYQLANKVPLPAPQHFSVPNSPRNQYKTNMSTRPAQTTVRVSRHNTPDWQILSLAVLFIAAAGLFIKELLSFLPNFSQKSISTNQANIIVGHWVIHDYSDTSVCSINNDDLYIKQTNANQYSGTLMDNDSLIRYPVVVLINSNTIDLDFSTVQIYFQCVYHLTGSINNEIMSLKYGIKITSIIMHDKKGTMTMTKIKNTTEPTSDPNNTIP